MLGAVIGAVLVSSVTCTTSLVTGKSCRNLFGEVSLDLVGEPNLVALGGIGAAVGAVVGALVGVAVAAVWPQTRENLF